jgi:hypothetical protein
MSVLVHACVHRGSGSTSALEKNRLLCTVLELCVYGDKTDEGGDHYPQNIFPYSFVGQFNLGCKHVAGRLIYYGFS